MEMIKIKTGEYYDRPEFYSFMPSVIFDALELAVLKGAVNGEEEFAEVPKDIFDKMIEDFKKENGK